MRGLIFSFLMALFCLRTIAQIPLSPEDRKNPFDYIGNNHNQALDFIVAEYPGLSSSFFNNNWKDIVTAFLKSKQFDANYFLNTFINAAVDNKCGSFLPVESITPEEELRKYLVNGLLSKVRYEKISEIYNLVNSVDALLADAGGDAAKAYSSFYEKMMRLEAAYHLLPEDDQNFCFMISSIANHSIWYWLNEGSKTYSTWGLPKCSTAGMRFNWGALGSHDVGGAVAGGIRSLVGVAVGGPVTWAAAGVAIIGGALAGSAAYAIASLF